MVAAGATAIHVGGHNGVDATGQMVAGDVAAQTRQVFANVVTALTAAGAGLADLVSLAVLLPNDYRLRMLLIAGGLTP